MNANSFTIPIITVSMEVKLPTVVRYLEEEYVDRFLSTGELMISGISKFHKHKDEQRGDQEEGLAHLALTVNGMPFNALISTGSNAYILSTSCIDDENLMTQLNYNSAIRINNSLGFAAAIAESMSFCRHTLQGFCIYRDSKKIASSSVTNHNLPDIKDLKNEDAEKFMSEMNSVMHEANQNESLFRKALQYAPQAEYRFIWFTLEETQKDSIIIKSPKAAKFCEKITTFPKNSELSTSLMGAKVSISTNIDDLLKTTQQPIQPTPESRRN